MQRFSYLGDAPPVVPAQWRRKMRLREQARHQKKRQRVQTL